MSDKTYPLAVVFDVCPDYRFFSKGHHDVHDFMAAVRATGADEQLTYPEHVWLKAVPDRTGSRPNLYSHAAEGARGAFPATLAVGCSRHDAYEAVCERYPSMTKRETV